ncbi:MULTISPECIES: putative zinc ribbon protein [unclassified Serratia (in: enterobacteria)]|uniref:putative zinc ribbon protein n=1 Tax=unclassified Serratia (in: enterobacteria) TaxID=2647522 RepID=UPI0030765229
MQFQKIDVGRTEGGQSVKAKDLSLKLREQYFCQSCGNPLHLYWTHTAGRYFEHHLEQAEEKTLAHCQYLLSPSQPQKPPTPFEQAVYDTLNLDNPFLGFPQPQRFHCVMCNHDYDGLKICPLCQDPIYTTEVKLRDLSGTLPDKWAK